MKITEIQQQKKRPDRVSVFIDGQFAFGLDSKFLIDFKLFKEREISETEIQELIRKDNEEGLKFQALKLISSRPRSEKEIRDYLFRKLESGKFDIAREFWDEIIDGIISDLKSIDLLNDAEYAKWHIENRMRFKPRGRNLLKIELRSKGIDGETISEVLENGQIDETELAKKLVEKKVGSLKRFDEKKRQEKMIAFLQRKGFGWDVIKKIIYELDLK